MSLLIAEEAGTKFAGSKWIQSLQAAPLSRLGIRVANVLGQVSRGIYHWDSVAYPRKPIAWQSSDRIAVPLSGRMGSFDNSELTALVLCSAAAGLEVAVAGRAMSYMAVEFRESDRIPFRSSDFTDDTTLEGFLHRCSALQKAKFRQRSANGRWLSFRNHSNLDITQLVVDAHAACIKARISGLSHQSVEVFVSKREGRTGNMYDRHPTWEQHVELLRPLWDIDFDSTT